MDYKDMNAIGIVKLMLTDGVISQEVACKYFPELKESEDERIWKFLAELVKAHTISPMRENALALLEKQGEHIKFLESVQIGDEVTRNPDGVLVNLSQLKRVAEQGSQNLANSAKSCKIEPKFKVGDWIVTDKNHIWIIDEDCSTTGYLYRLISQNGKVEVGDYNIVDEHARLWTIQDAKDGDVLVASDGSIFLFKCNGDGACKHYIALTTDYAVKFNEGLEHYWETSRAVHPATETQRDFLFQKMKEAGYEWDAEKKELKKIEQEQVIDSQVNLSRDNWEIVHEFIEKFGRIPKDEDELNALVEYVFKRQKPNWSDEDERTVTGILMVLESWDSSHVSSAGLPSLIPQYISWLKDFKEKYTWRPSDEQMEALKNAAKHFGGCDPDDWDATLESLYNDLKELK